MKNKYLIEVVHRCPNCLAKDVNFVRLFDVKILGILSPVYRCCKCNLIFKGFVPNQEGLSNIYNEDYVHFNKADQNREERLSANIRLARVLRMLSLTNPKGVSLLDVGCGSGAFVNTAIGLGFDAYGIDPYLSNESLNSRLSRRSIKTLELSSWDVVTAFNVIEHLVDPREFFAAVSHSLRPGGVLLLTCPWGNSLHRLIFKSAWSLLALDEHLLFWNQKSLDIALKESGTTGVSICRIGGAPFPIGYERPSLSKDYSSACTAADESKDNDQNNIYSLSVQWPMQLMRSIQRSRYLSGSVRELINILRIGCYLDYFYIKSRGNR